MEIKTYSLKNKNGMSMTVTNLGCAIITLNVPTSSGQTKDIVLGFDNASDYAKPHPFFGVVVGRFANRIGKGKFTLGGKSYSLETNDGAHHLHGGSDGFDKKIWDVEESPESNNGSKIVFVYNSPDGEAGYPGTLKAKVTYTLSDTNILRMDYNSTTDSETICNLTNHSYFNLSGHDDGSILDHELEILADKITAVDEGLIPTGSFNNVAGTAFDFRTAKPIGKDLKAAGEVNKTGGYDHNFCLNSPGKAASVVSPKTGIRMTISTDCPGIQLYTSNMIEGGGIASGKGAEYRIHSAFCLETQLFPDAINKPNFASCIVTKDKPQNFYTEFAFSW